jgi:WD40 repeat protein
VNAVPTSPYKGLAPFGDSQLDALLFFGREREREAIVANIFASKLTVLYGPSGVGKSSLLRAGVAQHLRTLDGGVVVVHDAWAEDPAAALSASVRAAGGELGPTAGLVDTVAAAANRAGEVFLLLDQFEEYFVYHGAEGSLGDELPDLLRRPGLRVNVLIAVRDDALSELDAFAGRVPALFANMLRLDRLDRRSARSAILGPLECYGELVGGTYSAEAGLIDAVLDEVAEGRVDFSGAGERSLSGEHVEAPFLQLVLERLWVEEQAAGSHELRLATLRRLGGAEPIVREHVQGTLERLPAAQQGPAAHVVRQLVTPSGTKISHTAADLAGYTDVTAAELQPLLATLVRERIVRGVDGGPSGSTRYEIFHDVLAAPVLAWRAGYELERERIAARRQRRRLLRLFAAALVALVAVGAIAVFALAQRSAARSQARRAHGRELAAQALAGIPTDAAASLALALRAAELAPGPQTESVLRSSLLAMRERRVLHLPGGVVAATFGPHGGQLLVAGGDGSVGIYDARGRRTLALPRQRTLTHAAWSLDGRLVATGAAGGTVSLWRARDGHRLRAVRTQGPISVLAFSGRKLLVGGGGHIRIVDGVGGAIRDLAVPGVVTAAALSPTGRLVAVAAMRDGRVATRILDAATGRVRSLLRERGIGPLAFSRDGRLLATGSTDRTARLWNAATGRPVHVLPHHGHVLAVRFSPDGRQLVTASADGTAGVWDVRSGVRSLLLVGATGEALDAAFSPDGREIAVAFADRLTRIYNAEDGRLLAPLAGHTDAVTSVGFDARGRVIVTAGDDGTARLWDAHANDQLTPIDRRDGPVDALFAGTRVVTAAGREARVLSRTGSLLRRIDAPAAITTVAAHGNSLALADAGGELELATLPGPPRTIRGMRVTALAYTPDGTLVTASRDGTIRIWRNATPTRIGHPPGPIVELSATRAHVLTRTARDGVRIRSLDGRLVQTLTARAQRAALAPEGTLAATTTANDVELWDVETGELLHRLRGHRSLVTDVEFSPDGTLVVTASNDHDARIWDVGSGDLLHVLRGHFFPVRRASFSPNGRWIVTASQFTAGLWNVATGQLVLYLREHERPLTAATFSPDGNWVLTASEDGTARIVRCDVCRDLDGLEDIARRRLRSID